MKEEILKSLKGYERVANDLEVSRRYGTDYTADRWKVQEYIDRLHPGRLRLRVAERIQETRSAVTLRLVPDEGALPPFQAGQYLSLFVDAGTVRTGRPYSISSPPSRTGHYDITVKRVEDGLVSGLLLDNTAVGDIIETSGPSGNFYFNPIIHTPAMVCIAGGSGITPFMSMIREIVECGLKRTVYLFYGNRDERLIFGDELGEIASRHDNIIYTPVIEKPGKKSAARRGFVDAACISGIAGDLSDKTFFICGPGAMYEFCTGELSSLGVPRRRIRREMYGPPARIWKHPAWPRRVKHDAVFTVSVRGRGSFSARADESLLTALEKNGYRVPSLCRCGECSMCRVRVMKGTVFQPEGVLLRKSDRQYNYVHSCAAYPLEDLEVLL